MFTKIRPIRELDFQHVTMISQWESDNFEWLPGHWIFLFIKIWPIRKLDFEHVTEISQWESENFNCFNIAAASCNQRQNFKIHREQNSTNQTEGFGSRDQNWPIRDEYFALSPFSALNGRDAKYSSRDWAILVTWHEQKKKKRGIVLISKLFLPSLSHAFSSPLATSLLYFPWCFTYLFFHFIAFTYLCCLDSIFIALAMSLVMIISLPIFSIFLSTLTFCSLDYVQCTGLCRYLCICILTLTFLFFLNRSWVVPSVMRTKDVWRTTTCVSREVSSIGFALSFPGFEPVNTPTTVQRTYHLLCRWAFKVLPRSVLCRSWASGLLLRSPAHYQQTFFFLHIFFDLNQRPLPLKPSTRLTVLARLRWWCEE